MSHTALEAQAAVAVAPRSRWRTIVDAYLELSKFRLSLLVLLTTAVGFVLGSDASVNWAGFGLTLVGTALAAFGANALNQCLEVERDGRMHRTQRRPLPSGHLTVPQGYAFGLAASVAGPAMLAATVNLLAAGLAAATILLYVVLYTPMKVRSPLNTLVGAVVGGIPPLIGWAGATGGIELGGWLLGMLLFLWQIPHFLALAWLYREDYARGGYRMLPAVDPHGALTSRVMLVYSLLLVPLGLTLALAGVCGNVYAVGSVLLAGGLLVLGLKFWQHRTNTAAKRVFLASVIYLPLILGLMVADRQPAEPAAGADDALIADVSADPHIANLVGWPGMGLRPAPSTNE